jgi:hypothetical protein
MIAEFQMQYENDKTKGKLLLTFGENHLFTVIVYADEAIWNENISVWQKILDEFKPDITQ